MTIDTESNKSLGLRHDLLKLKKQWGRETLLKALLATAALAAGIAAVIFMGSNFLAIGIGVIVISSLAAYHCIKHYRHTSNIFTRTAAAISLSRKNI